MLTASAVKHHASKAGFDLCGIAAAARHPKLARLAEWYAGGLAGEMRYLADLRGERADPRVVLPTARSVVSLAVLYNTDQPISALATGGGRVAVARYAWGEDYHVVLRARLRSDGRYDLSWIRRSRAGWPWIDGVDAPLGEDREAYRLTIQPDGGAARARFQRGRRAAHAGQGQGRPGAQRGARPAAAAAAG